MYVPCKAAGKRVNLSADYIARFCREGLVRAIRYAGAWYVDENSLATYLAEQERQREVYLWKLSAEAKEEAERAKFSAAQMIAPYPPPRKRSQKAAEVLVATLTLFAVTASGALAFHNIAPEKFALAINSVSATSQVAASSLPWLDDVASRSTGVATKATTARGARKNRNYNSSITTSSNSNDRHQPTGRRENSRDGAHCRRAGRKRILRRRALVTA